MAAAPGIGPRLTLEQELAIEAVTRFAFNAERDRVADLVRGLQLDNMMLRRALSEMLANENRG